MSKDISHILAGWDFDPEDMSVRIVTGDDGREKLQMRLDLGLMQMEMAGRPDGLQPEGYESWLDCFEDRLDSLSRIGDRDDFELSSEDCQTLLREGVQYYHRYLSFWNLGRHDLCARDTARNLRLFAFVKAHAKEERDKLQFDQWRPYVTMMHARAVATPLLNARDVSGALRVIERGISQIRKFLEEYRQLHRSQDCNELTFLERWRTEVQTMKTQPLLAGPVDVLARMKEDLQSAIQAERFEEAARLRDEIKRRTEAANPAASSS